MSFELPTSTSLCLRELSHRARGIHPRKYALARPKHTHWVVAGLAGQEAVPAGPEMAAPMRLRGLPGKVLLGADAADDAARLVGHPAVLLHDLLDAAAVAPRRVGRPEHAEDVHHAVRRRRDDRRRVPVPPEKDPHG